MPAWQDASEYDVNKAMDGHEGCNIYGWLDLQRVAGSFRISVHMEDFFQLAKVRPALPVQCQALCLELQLSSITSVAYISKPLHRGLLPSPYMC